MPFKFSVLAPKPPPAETVLAPTNNAHPQWWRDPGLRKLNMHASVLLLGSFVCGYDGSVLNAALGIDAFLDDVDNPDANKLGLLSSAISLGYLIGFFPSSWAGDRWGRKRPQIFGSAVVVVAVFVQCFALGGWKFFGARILLGFGAAFPLTLGSAHLFELAHPRQAAEFVTFFGSFYWVGAVVAAWVTYGSAFMSSNWSWRLPSLLQGLASLVQLATLWFVPESPRFLSAVGRTDEAHEILAKYHANGDLDDELVLSELAQIQTALELEQASKSFGYLDFLRTKANRYRLFLCIWIGVIVQWVGNGVYSYYLLPVLSSIGIEGSAQQQGINGGLQIFNLFISALASIYIQRFSRRFVWLFSTVMILLCYTMFAVATLRFNSTGDVNAGRAAVALIFLYSAFYDIAYSILFYSYTLEVLPYHMRTKGMAVCLFVDYGALFFNQYINPIGFEDLGTNYYWPYVGVIAVNLVVVYFLFPETAGLTLEQSAALLDDSTKERIDEAGQRAVKDLDATSKVVEA
ncbi:general substrate transporter [Rhodotorula diobovata]|uniref:General substrate transporter n=1 Tax=Rhodotorula diobovata TaxID=5288 RepID=A0A5C5FPE4_9BASI|nr:general substrate transporter [Rhodotorula diobovata]